MAAPGRFRLFAGWSSPWSHRSTLVLALTGLCDVVEISYVDSPADHGAAEVARLRRAYEADDPDFSGSVPVPTLWDEETRRVVTNEYSVLDVDLATEFRDWSTGIDLYPLELRDEIDALDRWLGPAVNQRVHRSIGIGGESARARIFLDDAFAALDRRLANSRYLLGDRLTLADLRLWVTLVRYDPPRNDTRRIGPALAPYRNLWAYAQSLYELEAFQVTTSPASFARHDGRAKHAARSPSVRRPTAWLR